MTVAARLRLVAAELAALAEALDPAAASPPRTKLDDLRTACSDLGIAVSGDGYVGEVDAARLLRKAPATVRNWRHGSAPLPHRKSFGGRIEYALATLAAHLEKFDG